MFFKVDCSKWVDVKIKIVHYELRWRREISHIDDRRGIGIKWVSISKGSNVVALLAVNILFT